MADDKMRAFSQRVGVAGENAFRDLAERQDLTIAAKVEEDFGVDFMCQAARPGAERDARAVIPAHFGTCVRATVDPVGRVKLTRADAANMLRYRQPLIFVLVHIVDEQRICYFRIVDVEFGKVLSDFLGTDHQTMSLLPADCRPETKLRPSLDAALRPSAVRSTQLGLAELRLRQLAPGVSVQLLVDPTGEMAVFAADDYFEFFEQLDETEQNSVYAVAFGRPDLFDDRSASLPFRHDIPATLVDTPDRIALVGGVTTGDVELQVSSSEGGVARATFTYTRIGTHFGWVHSDGLSITVSGRTPAPDGTIVHRTRVFIDADADLNLDQVSDDLRLFLIACVPGAILSEVDGTFSMEVDYFNLPRLCEIFRAYDLARTLPSWDPDVVQLRDLRDVQTSFTIVLLGGWRAEPQSFPPLGVYLETESNPLEVAKMERVAARGSIDVVLSTVRASVIATVTGAVTELHVDTETVGIAKFEAQGVDISVVSRIDRQEGFPEVILAPGYTLVLDPAGIRFSEAPLERDDLGYRSDG